MTPSRKRCRLSEHQDFYLWGSVFRMRLCFQGGPRGARPRPGGLHLCHDRPPPQHSQGNASLSPTLTYKCQISFVVFFKEHGPNLRFVRRPRGGVRHPPAAPLRPRGSLRRTVEQAENRRFITSEGKKSCSFTLPSFLSRQKWAVFHKMYSPFCR